MRKICSIINENLHRLLCGHTWHWKVAKLLHTERSRILLNKAFGL